MQTTKNTNTILAEIKQIALACDAYAESESSFTQLKELFDHMLSDLQIHQEELRAQNEELQAAQQEAETLYTHQRALFDLSPTALVHISGPDCRIRSANATAARLFGRSGTTVMEGRSLPSYFHTFEQDAVGQHLRALFETRGMGSLETAIFSLATGRRDVELHSVVVTDPDTQADMCLCTVIDITARKQAEEKSRLAAKVFARSSEGIAITDGRGHILTVNDAFAEITGFSAKDVAGKTLEILDSDRQSNDLHARIRRGLADDGWWQGRAWRRYKDGKNYQTWLNVTAVTTRTGAVSNYVYMLSDITSIRKERRRMEYFATHDELTDLSNRSHFVDRVGQAAKRAASRADHGTGSVSVLFMDLDNFKNINDTEGHEAGDRLLQSVADRLRTVVRDEDALARFGGDEFTLVIEDRDAGPAAAKAARRILKVMSQPFQLGRSDVFVTVSIGISVAQDAATDAPLLLKQADVAMYQAKSLGKNQFRIYTDDMADAAHRRMRLENGIRSALAKDGFKLVFQPIVDLTSRRIRGAEALLRLELEDGEIVPPSEFIPAAEKTGLITEISKMVCSKVFKALADWTRRGIAVPQLSINLSGRDIQGDDIPEFLATLAGQYKVDASSITLELTEGVFMENQDAALKTLAALRGQGYGIAIDDFGSGYSSLGYLRTYPITGIKIDRSFIAHLDKKDADVAILRAIIDLSNKLGMTAIGEGVETEAQAALLASFGCTYAQGYGFHNPMPEDAFLALIEEQDAGPARPGAAPPRT